MSEQELVNKQIEPLPVLVYGRPDCEDTALLRFWLQENRISFVEIDSLPGVLEFQFLRQL